MQEHAIQLIKKYYEAFNHADMQAFFALLDDNIIHDINQGHQEKGKSAFQKFMQNMNQCYKENITDLVIFTNENGTRAAAEFTVKGAYISTDKGFPEAKNQHYQLPAGAFFEIKSGKIARVTNYYNVKEWVKIISEQ